MGDSYSTEMQGGRVEWILDLCGVLVCQEGGLIDGVDGSIGVLWCGVWHWRFTENISLDPGQCALRQFLVPSSLHQ